MLTRTYYTSLYVILQFSYIACAVEFPVDSSSGKITYTEVVIVDSSTTKDVLYSNAREWSAKAFKSVQHVIQIDDKDDGTIVLKGSFETSINCRAIIGPSDYVEFTMTIYTKDFRYKYIITDLILNTRLANGDSRTVVIEASAKRPKFFMPKRWLATQQIIDQRIIDIIASLKTSMLSTKIKKEKDW